MKFDLRRYRAIMRGKFSVVVPRKHSGIAKGLLVLEDDKGHKSVYDSTPLDKNTQITKVLRSDLAEKHKRYLKSDRARKDGKEFDRIVKQMVRSSKAPENRL